MNIKDLLRRLVAQEELTHNETYEAMLAIARGEYSDVQIAALLTAIQARGVTADELLGFRQALVQTGTPVDLHCDDAIDIVGTGGDGKNTFNISTCTGFVVAGAGYPVAKHGGAAATSVSGASNVLECLGAKFTHNEAQLQRSLHVSGFTYMHAPLFALGMKHVAPVRCQLGTPTAFNLLGPLINPAQPRYQLLGVANLFQLRLYKEVVEKLNLSAALVHTFEGYDEISLTGDFKVLMPGCERVFSPSTLGFAPVRQAEISGGTSVQEAATIFTNVLQGKATEAQTNVVLANAAFAIGIVQRQKSVEECLYEARTSIDSGKALEALKKYLEINS